MIRWLTVVTSPGNGLIVEAPGSWELKTIKKMIKDLGMVFALVAGCEVGVRDPKSGKPMKKMWKLATTNVKIACRMAVDCAGGHETCLASRDGQQPRHTTPDPSPTEPWT